MGNAVPPKLSYAIAKSILLDSKKPAPQGYIPIQHDEALPFYNLNHSIFPPKEENPKRSKSKFKYHIPYMIINAFRVELTNYHSDFKKEEFIWTAEIHYSQGKDKAKIYNPSNVCDCFDDNFRVNVSAFIDQIKKSLSSYNDFQKNFCMLKSERDNKDVFGPYELLDSVKCFLDNALTLEDWNKTIFISDNMLNIPKATAAGFYVLSKVINEMGDIPNEC